MDALLVETLRELIAEVQGLRADLRAAPAGRLPSLSRADRAQLTRLLPVIVGARGSEESLVRDLFEDESPALQLALRGLNAKRVGKLFRRAAGQVVAAYLVEQAGVELNMALWRVVQVKH